MPARRRESTIEAQIIEFAKSLGFTCYKFVSPGQRGVPDRMFINTRGDHCYIEVKKTGETPTPWQLRQIGILNRLKPRMAIWCDNIQDAKSFLLIHQ